MKYLKTFVLCLIFTIIATLSFGDEVIYLTDSLNKDVTGGTVLYSVDLDSGSNKAELTKITTFAGLAQVDALAATVDGQFLYAIDKYCGEGTGYCGTGVLGRYEVATDSFFQIGPVVTEGTPNKIQGVVLAAVSSQGELFVVSQDTKSLYKVNPTTAEATLVGPITGATPQGADIAFDSAGVLYLWTNNGSKLYTLDPVTAVATLVNIGAEANFTGLAVRGNGTSDLIGSVTAPEDLIRVLDKGTATTIIDYLMVNNAVEGYDYGFGDMTNAPLVTCTRTIGYWKNHDWPVENPIDLCGQPVSEEDGKTILMNARGKNFSMFFAQLIAAELNLDNSGAAAEAWACGLDQGERFGNLVTETYSSDFSDKAEKKIAAAYWGDLDEFNNSNECTNDVY